MNSYPVEFLAHHAPLMFVAGLGTTSSYDVQSSTGAIQDAPNTGRRNTLTNPGMTNSFSQSSLSAATEGLKISGYDAGLNTPETRSRAGSVSNPSMGSAGLAEDETNLTAPTIAGQSNAEVLPVVDQARSQDDFELLQDHLRKSFMRHSAKANVWPSDIRPDAEGKLIRPSGGATSKAVARRMAWRTVLVDKAIRLPPKKVAPVAASNQQVASPMVGSTIPHSPLSPLTAGSITYPDGLITPTWVRKHSEVLPSVFVLFARLYEHNYIGGQSSDGVRSPTNPATAGRSRAGSLLDATDPVNVPIPPTPAPSSPSLKATRPNSVETGTIKGSAKELDRQRREAERRADEEMVKEIADRRRKLIEKVTGIKMTVVLMASRDALDDTGLDSRLSFIRRQSGLDTKASLFVLTPVSDEELEEFVTSLQEALYEPSQEFYANHYKRNRKKRGRLPSNPNQLPYPVAVPAGTKVLLASGWAARYDYKAGLFAEIRGDFDIARRGYEDAWYDLVNLFASVNAMQPRTKRWAEAKVLADCTAQKVCRLFLYYQDTSAALGFFQQHIDRFTALSKSWGIGDDTFEYWAWLARQYRMFAELLELSIAAGLWLEVSLPVYLPTSPTMASPDGAQVAESVLVSSNAPSTVLQHPGYYYYAAADCSVQRKQRFDKISGRITDSEHVDRAAKTQATPGLANEQRIDHTAIILELYTKAYSHFKRTEGGQSRMSLYIAFRIAQCHSESGRDEMTMKYCQRILRPYASEGWGSVVWAIRALWYQAAQRTASVETAVKLLLEMMAPGGAPVPQDATQYQDDLQALLTTTAPENDNVDIHLPSQAHSIFEIAASYVRSEANLGDAVGLLVEIVMPNNTLLETLSLSSVTVQFSGGPADWTIEHDGELSSSAAISCGGEKKANLNFRPGKTLRLAGNVTSDAITRIGVQDIVLAMDTSSWKLRMHSGESLPLVDSVLGSMKFSFVNFVKLPLDMHTRISIPDIVYRSTPATVVCSIHNRDSRSAHLRLSADLRDVGSDPERPTVSGNPVIRIGEQESPVTIKEYQLEIIRPGETLEVILQVTSHDTATQLLAVALQESDVEEADASTPNYIGISSTNLAFVEPLEIDYESWITSIPISTSNPPDNPGLGHQIALAFNVRMVGEQSIEVLGITYRHEKMDEAGATIQYQSIDDDSQGEFPQIWKKNDSYGAFNAYDIAIIKRTSLELFQGEIDILWRIVGSTESCHSIRPFEFRFDVLKDLTCTISPPTQVALGTPFKFELAILNDHDFLETDSLTIQLQPSQSFTWTDFRQLPLPAIKPKQRWTYTYEMTASAGTGWQPLPRIIITGRQRGLARELDIADGRDAARLQPIHTGLPVFIRA